MRRDDGGLLQARAATGQTAIWHGFVAVAAALQFASVALAL
jgi:predicted membrane channel-forming protein YqfA (hemolysin III family)